MPGHGWVIPNPSGMKARCGGPAFCDVCKEEERIGRALTSEEEEALIQRIKATDKATEDPRRPYKPTPEALQRLENSLSFFPVRDEETCRFNLLRLRAKDFGVAILEGTPASREQSLALTELENCLMWAKAAICRNERK